MVLLTDAIADPDPKDWPDVPTGWDVRSHSMRKTVELVGGMGIPLYVVLVGDPVGEVAGRDREQSPGFVLDLVRAANGAAAAPLAQTLASFFQDDGLLLRKFVYRVAPDEGLKKIEPVVTAHRVAAARGHRAQDLRYFVLPLLLILVALLGLLVRSFPGPGDLEILELARRPARRTWRPTGSTASPDGTWSAQGLSLAADARAAAATFTLLGGSLELTGAGLDTDGLDPRDAALLPLGLDGGASRPRVRRPTPGAREDKIHALNLDYAARSLAPRGGGAGAHPSPGERTRIGRGRLRAGQGAPRPRRGAAPAAPRAPRPGRDLREGRRAAARSRRAAPSASAATASSCARSRGAAARTRGSCSTTTACPPCSA